MFVLKTADIPTKIGVERRWMLLILGLHQKNFFIWFLYLLEL